MFLMVFPALGMFGETKNVDDYCVIYFVHKDIRYGMFEAKGAFIDNGGKKAEKLKYESAAFMLSDMKSKGWKVLDIYPLVDTISVYVFEKK